MNKRAFVKNQVFLGLPWKTVRPKYERCLTKLNQKYPLYFVIVGRDENQTATGLFDLIKNTISSSSSAIFDATGGNPNVSLEYGFAEGIQIEKCIFLSDRKDNRRPTPSSPIISDLSGMTRVQYKTERTLFSELERFSRRHDFTVRYEKALRQITRNKSKGQKKTYRALALKAIHFLDGRSRIRRDELLQHLEAKGASEQIAENLIKGLHREKLINCSPGRHSFVSVR